MMYLNEDFGGEAAQIGWHGDFVWGIDKTWNVIVNVQ